MESQRIVRPGIRSFLSKPYLALGIMAVLTMLLATLSSPLYPLNNWVDSNAYFTMGKAMFNGKVLYRDVFDHKGPILHFLHGLAWMISHKSFFGVYLLEVVACYFTLLCSYRILELYTDKKALLVMPAFAVILYTADAMAKGDSAEELCLPFLMYGVFLMVRSLKEKQDIPPKSLLLLGVTSGVVLWIKYTMLGFYLGWVILPLVLALKEKNFKYIRNMVLYIGAGVLLTTVPVLIYFLVNGALWDLWDVYFYTNIFQYASDSIGLRETAEKLLLVVRSNFILDVAVMTLTVIGGIWAVCKREFLPAVQISLMMLGGLLGIYLKSTPMPYYAFIFFGFSIFGFIPLYGLFRPVVAKCSPRLYAGILAGACLLILPATWLMSDNTEMFQYRKEDLPQFQFARIINQKEDATVLNCGFMDGGFYTVSGVVPNIRHFCLMNVDVDEAFEMQKEAVHSGAVDFVITKDRKLNSDGYEERMVSTFSYRGEEYEYTLYQRKID